jgi:hypothetical protein
VHLKCGVHNAASPSLSANENDLNSTTTITTLPRIDDIAYDIFKFVKVIESEMFRG